MISSQSRGSIIVLQRKNGNWNKCPRCHFRSHLASSRLRVDKSETSKDADRAPTNITLPVEICLARGSIGTGKFPVDLVLDIAHSDKSGHDTIPTARLHWIEEISGSSRMRMKSCALNAVIFP
jgi:hypothetical protein